MNNATATAFGHARHIAAAFVRDEAAVTAIEYALLASLIAVAILAGVTLLGDRLGALWTMISETVDGVL